MGYAWGPEREYYSSHADWPVLNSMIDAPGIGDERNFVRVREAGTVGARTDFVEVTVGGRYEVYIYFRNDAEVEALTGVRAQSYFSRFVSDMHDAMVMAGLKADDREMIWDSAKFVTQSSRPLELRYVDGSATIHSMGKVNGLNMVGMFAAPGAEVGFDVLNGTLIGGLKYAGYITYEVEAVRSSEMAADYDAIYGDSLADAMAVAAVEEQPIAQGGGEISSEMPTTGSGGGIVLAILMGALVALGWSLLHKIGNYGKIE